MKRRSLPWVAGILTATAMMGAILLWGSPHYHINDDVNLLLLTMGYGAPSTYVHFVNSALIWLLCGLNQLAQGIPWFSIFQLAAIWLSTAVVVKCLLQCAINHNFPAWLGFVAGILYIGTFFLVFAASITYTVTAAMLGAAACLQIISVNTEESNGSVTRRLLLATILLVMSYCLRPQAGLAALPFAIISLAILPLLFPDAKRKRLIKPACISLLTILLSIGGLYGFQQYEISLLNMQDFVAFNEARTQVMDYLPSEKAIAPKNYEAAGWDTSIAKLILDQWCMLDEDATTKAFSTIVALENAQRDRSFSHRCAEGWRLFVKALDEGGSNERPVKYGACAIIATGLLFVCGLVASARTRERRFWLLIGLLATFLVSLGLCGYLAYTGRVIMRAILPILLPATAVMLGLLFCCGRHALCRRDTQVALLAATLAFSFIIGLNIADIHPYRLKRTPSYAAAASLALEQYGKEYPETLILAANGLLEDNTLFRTFPDGIPQNLTAWVSWTCRLPYQQIQLARWGIDANAFYVENYLREDVVLAVLNPQIADLLCRHISLQLYPDSDSEAFSPVTYFLLDELFINEDVSVYIYQFYLDEDMALLVEP